MWNDLYSIAIADDNSVIIIGNSYYWNQTYIFEKETETSWIQTQTVSPPANDDPLHNSFFGYSVAVTDSIAMVGAPAYGSVYVYEKDESTAEWLQVQKLQETVRNERFGEAISISNDIAVITAPFADVIGADSGAAYMYKYDASSWYEVGAFVPDDATTNHQFGFNVSISNNAVIVSAADTAYIFEDIFENSSTYAYHTTTAETEVFSSTYTNTKAETGVFSSTYTDTKAETGVFSSTYANTPTQSQYIEHKLVLGDLFSNSLLFAMRDNTAVISSFYYHYALIFERTELSWLQTQTLMTRESTRVYAVAMTEDAIFMADPYHAIYGAVDIYAKNGTFIQTLLGENKYDNFGYSIAASKDTVVIATRKTFIYIFENDGINVYWNQTQQIPITYYVKYLAIADDNSFIISSEDWGTRYFVLQKIGALWTPSQIIQSTSSGKVAATNDFLIIGGNPSYIYGKNYDIEESYEFVIMQTFEGENEDGFGTDVSILNDIAVITAPYADVEDYDSGAAYIYKYDADYDSWDNIRTLLPNDATIATAFGVNVFISNDDIMISDYGYNVYIFENILSDEAFLTATTKVETTAAPTTLIQDYIEHELILPVNNASGIPFVAMRDNIAVMSFPVSGAAYIFERINAEWVQTSELVLSITLYSVTVINDAVFVCDPYSNNGAVHIYQKDAASGSWPLIQILHGTESYGRFGIDIASSNDTVVILAEMYFSVYKNNGSSWIHIQQIVPTPSLYMWNDLYSIAIADDNSVIIIGNSAYYWNQTYIFEKETETSWIQTQIVSPPADDDPLHNSVFGYSVAVTDSIAMVGAPAYGSVYVYEKDESTAEWLQVQKLEETARNERFGEAISISNDIAVITAPFADVIGADSGAAYMYKYDASSWYEVGAFVPEGATTNHQFGFNVSISNNAVIVSAADTAYIFEDIFDNLPTYAYTSTTSRTGIISSGLWRLICGGILEDLMAYLSGVGVGIDAWAQSLFLNLLSDISTSVLASELVIIIHSVSAGSIIIEYELLSEDEILLNNALDLINASIGTNYTLYSDWNTFPILWNEVIESIETTQVTQDATADELGILMAEAIAATAGAVGLSVFFILICCICSVCCFVIVALNLILKCNKKYKEKQKEKQQMMAETLLNSVQTEAKDIDGDALETANETDGENGIEMGTIAFANDDDDDVKESHHDGINTDANAERNAMISIKTYSDDNKVEEAADDDSDRDGVDIQVKTAGADSDGAGIQVKTAGDDSDGAGIQVKTAGDDEAPISIRISSSSDDKDDIKTDTETDRIERTVYLMQYSIALPLRFVMHLFGRIFTCNGCNQKTGSFFIHFLTSTFSTSLLLTHFSSAGDANQQEALSNGVSGMFFGGSISGETIYGSAIIAFALMTFVGKLIKLRKSNQEWNEKPNETSVSIRIKDLNVVVIGASDTIFKVLAGFAVIIGSAYAGMDSNDEFDEATIRKVIDYIFIASLFGPVKEIGHLLEHYLTFAVMFVSEDGGEMSNTVTKKAFDYAFDEERIKNGIFDSVFDKINEIPETKPKYSAQKTILWNAVWGGFKLSLLCIQQMFGFLAAALLLGTGKDVAWFLLIVLLFNLAIILIAFIFCTKYQRMSIGLFCKYYFCCFYNLCPLFCEEKLIKLDPVERGLEFNHLGFYELKLLKLASDDKMPHFYRASYSQGMYGCYTAVNEGMPHFYRASYCQGIYGSYTAFNDGTSVNINEEMPPFYCASYSQGFFGSYTAFNNS